MPNIYLTINHYNKANGIAPYLYSGSDQNDNAEYIGSSKYLKEDIQKLGKENFEKVILFQFANISNKDLRKIESNMQVIDGHKKDARYYNKTDKAGPACGVKGMKHGKKFERSQVWINSRTGSNWSDEQKERRCGSGNPMFGKTITDKTKDIWKSKKRSIGANNPNALHWDVTIPTGEIYKDVVGLRSWCNDHNLSYSQVYGQRKGYKLIKYGQGKGGPGK